jgi:tetratricopeptide (TPR) repeat protein
MDTMKINVIKPLLEYWPYSTANAILAAETYIAIGDLEEGQFWADRAVEVQMSDIYMGEYYQMQVLLAKGDMEGLRKLYEFLKSQSEFSLSKSSNTYNILHSMAINLQDYGMVSYFYDKFLEYHGESASMVINQAVFYVNTGDYANAITYMSRANELNPNHGYAQQFRKLIDEYSTALGQ